jgi:hypothetical protein
LSAIFVFSRLYLQQNLTGEDDLMKNRWFSCLLLALLLAVSNLAVAAGYEVRPGIEISFEPLALPWQVSKEPPDFLIQKRAAHLHAAQLEAARKAGIDSPEEAARQMLKAEELFLFNPESGAHLTIDFSPLREGEAPPRAGTLKASASYAAEDLKDEDGIEGAKSKIGKIRIKGTKAAYRVDADFLMHGTATRFIGVITFARDHWIYLYYTGPHPGLEDLAVVSRFLEGFSIAPGKN